jgi:predicted secreted Zn-dependent protease
MDFNARTTSSGARGEVGHHLKISVGCSWWGFGSELVVKGEFTLKMIVLAPSDPKWALRYPRYNKKWGVNRSNAGERNATIAHEKDHWQTYIAFEDILKVLNVMEGRKCCPCSKFVVALQAKVKSIHAAAVKHSREFDDVAWWDGGNYAKRPFVPDALPTCK